MGAVRRVAPLVLWVAALLAIIVGLAAVGGTLPSPPLTQPGMWTGWFEAQPPVHAVFGVLRVLAIAAGGYLLATTVLATVARMARAAGAIRVADALTLPMVRRLAATAVGMGLATAALTGLSDDVGWSGGGRTVVTAQMAEAGDGDVAMESLGDPDGAGVTMALLDEAGEAADGEVARAVVVESGDHLWGVAERVLTEHHGHPPPDTEVVTYWQRLVEANRDRLADPDNPDLIYPGQEFVLPAVDAAQQRPAG